MTFSEARTKHLADLDETFRQLRDIVADARWCNPDFKAYKETIKNFAMKLDRIRELNQAEVEAS